MNVEGGLWWYAHVVELLGCFSRGASRAEALGSLPRDVEARIAWVRDRGLSCPERSALTVVEEQVGIPELGESGGATAIFRSDLEPINQTTLGEVMQLMKLSRQELHGVVGGLGGEVLDAEPIPGKRSIRRDIDHIVNSEEWYVSRLGQRYQRVYECELQGAVGRRRLSVIERLEVTRPAMMVAFEMVLGDGRQGPFTRRAYSKYPGERWTLRKVLRRFLEHEREHLGTINRTLGELSE